MEGEPGVNGVRMMTAVQHVPDIFKITGAYLSAEPTMMFVVTLTHTPEMCLARPEFGAEFKRWADGMEDLAKSLNIRIRDIFSCPTEHTFYFILEAGEYRDITTFFSGIMLTNHTGRISPVVTLQEASALIK